MSCKQLILNDAYGRKLIVGTFAGQMTVLPIVEKIGDIIAIDHHQAHLLKLWLEEHLK
jgi:hypothetical protein